jgi:hypothetical protein
MNKIEADESIIWNKDSTKADESNQSRKIQSKPQKPSTVNEFGDSK